MRILQVHTRYREPGGEDVVVADERGLLQAAGHEVYEFVADNPTRPLESVRSLALSSWNPRSARDVASVARRVQPDLAHVHNTWFAMSPSVLAGLDRTGVPIVASVHNFRLVCVNGLLLRGGRACEDCVGSHPGHGVVHGCYRGSHVLSAVAATSIATQKYVHTWGRCVDRFTVLSEFARSKLADQLPSERVVVRENFSEDPGERPSRPSQSNTIMFIGRLSAEKGLDTLLDAWERLAPGKLELVVAGDGPIRAELERRRTPRVRFIGQISHDEAITRLLSARGLVFPSRCYEAGFPRVPIEALAAGLPLVMIEDVTLARSVETAKAGWLAASDDPVDLAHVLEHFDDSSAVDLAGEAGRRHYLARYTPAHGLASLERVYAEAIDHRQHRT